MKKIAVLGAGFGGLRAAIQISRKLKSLGLLEKYGVVLIDRNEHHTYTPLLYEVATTSKKAADLCELHRVVAYKLADLIKHFPIALVQSEIKGIDAATGKIKLADNSGISCDYAVLALGSETNYFDIKGLREYSLPFKTLLDAIRIRDTILGLIEEGSREVTIAVGGGGSTGVELAGELKMWCGELQEEYRKCRINVVIIEGAPSILPGFPPRIVNIVKKRLTRLNVRVIENERIAEVRERKALLQSGKEIPFDVLVWAGGVKSPAMLAETMLKTEMHGRLDTAERMECAPKAPDLKLFPRIYAIGDNVCVHNPSTGKPIPGVARAAIQEADIAAHNLVEEIKAAEFKGCKLQAASYAPKEYPYIIPVGGKFAIAQIGPFVVSGFFGWLLKGLVELYYLTSIMPISKALNIWLKGLKIFIQNDRLG